MRNQENHHDHHHIVMLPFMAQGHLIPFLALAKQINQRLNLKITIASTPLNINYLESAMSKTNNSSVRIILHKLPFDGTDYDLPPHAENTEGLPLARVVNLFHASTSLKEPLEQLIQDITAAEKAPPLCIISDVFMGWASEVASSFNTVNVTYSTCGAYGTAAYASMWQHLPHRSANTDEFTLPGFPESCVFSTSQLHHFLRVADGTDSWSRFFQPQIGKSLKSFAWLINTCEEIEPLGLEVIRRYTKLPVWCIGPLLPQSMLIKNDKQNSSSRVVGKQTGREPGVSVEKCLQWLDSHDERSVLYISFGSQNTISASQMMALAMGLEASKRPFVWVIRPPIGFDSKEEFRAEWLPQGFEERVPTGSQGLIVRGWAPQLDILCHRSTGAFLSHCGWNSTLESLSQGVPMIGWPLAAEQGYNAKMLVEETGVCVEMTRGVQTSITKEHVVDVIEAVMGCGDRAEDMKRKACEIAGLIRASMTEEEEGSRKGSSLKALDDFVDDLIVTRSNQLTV